MICERVSIKLSDCCHCFDYDYRFIVIRTYKGNHDVAYTTHPSVHMCPNSYPRTLCLSLSLSLSHSVSLSLSQSLTCIHTRIHAQTHVPHPPTHKQASKRTSKQTKKQTLTHRQTNSRTHSHTHSLTCTHTHTSAVHSPDTCHTVPNSSHQQAGSGCTWHRPRPSPETTQLGRTILCEDSTAIVHLLAETATTWVRWAVCTLRCSSFIF